MIMNRIKKLISLVIFILVGFTTVSSGQDLLGEWQNTLRQPDQALQAYHTYPEDIKDGECHWVEVTSVTIEENKITIVEEWKNFRGGMSKTTLWGEISGNKITGAWKSSFSGGNWEYDLIADTGKWNKTKSFLFGKFKDWQDLNFGIINKKDLKDGFYPCP